MPSVSRKLVHVSFGPANRLYSEEHFYRVLAPLGLSRRGFRAFLRALSVPVIEVGSVRLIDALSFSIALRAITRIGAPDFLAPSSASIRRGRRSPTSTSMLSLKSFQESCSQVIAELLAAHKMRDIPLPAIRDAASAAASRLALAGLSHLPADARDRLVASYLPTLSLDASLPPPTRPNPRPPRITIQRNRRHRP